MTLLSVSASSLFPISVVTGFPGKHFRIRNNFQGNPDASKITNNYDVKNFLVEVRSTKTITIVFDFPEL